MSLELTIYDLDGREVGQYSLPEELFGARVNEAVMHQALVRQQANARVGTAHTKTRSEVSGGGRKPWRQKGTGRARQGSIRAPQWRGGGIVHGPRGARNYSQDMPRQMRRLALKSALTVKAQEGQIRLLAGDGALEQPKTRRLSELLDQLGMHGTTLLLVLEGDRTLAKSVSNLPRVKALRAEYLNVRDLVGYDHLLLSLPALERIQAIWGNS